ncbi:PREDICTED: cytochrome P450 94A2-like [Ipomoea nil]|uniref:cytochrome P450 94A2-like n=1 Tax=Ipomoea nil TaxID=35883 RepID=UPI0009018057|nr:PREDICTED: cytochrome P450 94A2-like [Ipomoea nil]
MAEISIISPLILFTTFLAFPLLLFLLTINLKKTLNNLFPPNSTKIPRAYPIIGSFFSILANQRRRVQWIAEVINSTGNLTFVLHRPLGYVQVFTANPSNVEHMLKTHFHVYQKGEISKRALADLMGQGIFNTDGPTWKFQRQLASYEFNMRSLRKFVEIVVDTELTERLVPILAAAAAGGGGGGVLDLQDILQRFAFDNICKIAFGYDPEYLLPCLPEAKFAVAFEESVRISSERFNSIVPLFWKIKRILNVGSEKKLREVVGEVREFARKMIREKKEEIGEKPKSSVDSLDLLSRFLTSGHSDENFITDIVISFILAGRDTTSAALSWFFWLAFKHPRVEEEIVREVFTAAKCETPVYDEVKEMVYTHASLCETMRLYPPVPVDTKAATQDDVLPDGTPVKKGTRVSYHPYAMGRVEKVWGADWRLFRPERWLDRDAVTGKYTFVGKDPFTYPVFQAGPRVCLGKEMAFLQMKRVVAGVLRRFTVVPATGEAFQPVYTADLTSKMMGGFPVRIVERPAADDTT